MKRILIFLSAIMLSLPVSTQAAEMSKYEALKRIRENLRQAYLTDYAGNEELKDEFLALSENGLANDAVMNQLFLEATLSEKDFIKLEMDFRPSSSKWYDIDYENQNRGIWPTALHLSRLCAMAKVYQTKGHSLYQAKRMKIVMERGASWWVRKDPVNPNWWWNEIGIPRKMGFLLTIGGDLINEDVRKKGLEIMSRSCTDARLTGQNLVWEAGNLMVKAILEKDYDTVTKMKEIIESQVSISQGEGLRQDWSFHLHGPMLQFGNYGLAFFDSIAFWMRVTEGTPWEFSEESKRIIAGFADNGIGWCFYKGRMDPSMRGRHMFPGSGRGKGIAFEIGRKNLKAAGIKTKKRHSGGNYFPDSDCGIFQGCKWYASIRMQSMRTLGYEMTNGENMNGFYSADGVMLTMTEGDEYEDIFPTWNWRKLPGTTVREGDGPTPAIDPTRARNETAHVGGLASKKVLAATMELQRDSLNAFKSVFLFKDIAVNLGCGIRSSVPGTATTSLEQNYLRDDFAMGRNFVYNAGKGYRSLDGKGLSMTTNSQCGAWNRMDPQLPDSTVCNQIFCVYVNHEEEALQSSEGDSYAYEVIPGKISKVAKVAAKNPVTILSNDSVCQAVSYKGVTAAVFHEAGSIQDGKNTITANGPCVIVRTRFPSSEKIVPLPEAGHISK